MENVVLRKKFVNVMLHSCFQIAVAMKQTINILQL